MKERDRKWRGKFYINIKVPVKNLAFHFGYETWFLLLHTLLRLYHGDHYLHRVIFGIDKQRS